VIVKLAAQVLSESMVTCPDVPNCFEGKLYWQIKRMVYKFILGVGGKLARGDECGKQIVPGWGTMQEKL
jgi:hypothetical protein